MAQCSQCGNILTGSPKFCPFCGTPVDARSEGAQTVTTEQPKVPTRRVGRILFPIVIAAGLGIFFIYVNPSEHSVIGDQPKVEEAIAYDTVDIEMVDIVVRDEGDELVFPLAELKRSRLVRFEYKTKTTTRPVLAYVAPNGKLVTAISVSEHCGSSRFKLNGTQILCAQCPSRWDMLTMEAYACCAKYYPDPIPSRVVGDDVHIAKSVIEQWAGRL